MQYDASQNYFQLFSLPQQFDLDLAALEQVYFALQRKYHPDRFVGKKDAERKEALALSMQVNDGYHTLKDPLLRARYLLHLNGIEVNGEKDTIKPSQALLMELMELREAFEDSGNTTALSVQVETLIDDGMHTLLAAFAARDLTAAAHQAIRLNYLAKLLRDVELAARNTDA